MCWMSMGEPACMQLPLEGNLTHIQISFEIRHFYPLPHVCNVGGFGFVELLSVCFQSIWLYLLFC